MSARLKELRTQRAGLVKEANTALDAAIALAEKEQSALTEADQAAQTAFNAKLAGLNSRIAAEEMRIERTASAATPVPDAGDVPAEEEAPEPAEAPKFARQKASASARPYIVPATRRTSASASPGEFKAFGQMLKAVRQAARNPQSADQRLFATASGASEAVDADGGFLVQQQWGGTLLQGIYETGILTREVRRMTLDSGANSIKFNLIDETSRANGSRFGGIQAYWAGEADAATATKPRLRRIEAAPKKLIGLMYATDELLEDASALEGFVNEWFPSEFGFKLDDAIFQGTGAGQPLGILNSPAKVTINKEAGQATKTINATNVEKMFAAMLPFSMGNARWYINVETLPQLFQMYHAIGTAGVPVYLPAGGISSGPYGTLFGRPVQAIEQTAALGTEGDIVFVDPQRYLLVDKGPIENATSIHVKFLTDESVFRWTVRVDGMPIPNSALTPYKGAQTLSPFITLQTR